MIDKKIEKILHTNDEQQSRLNQIALDAINEQELLTKELYIGAGTTAKMSFGDRLADKVADFGGSWKFIIIFMVILFSWIIVNVWLLATKPFDPYPFILLNLILSCIAALQAPVIMMSQNRKEDKDRQRAENDYLINLKAEIEIRMINQKIDILMSEQMLNLLEIHRKELQELAELKKNSQSKK